MPCCGPAPVAASSAWLFAAACVCASLVSPCAGAGSNNFAPPLYDITAATLYDAGFQHGTLARERIKEWFGGAEVQALVGFVKTEDGRKAFDALRRASSDAFPQYAEELHGIADGAGVTHDLVWTNILMIELQNLMSNGPPPHANTTSATGASPARASDDGHCTDISAISTGGYAEGFAHGHNEDWSVAVGRLYYYVKYTYAPAAPHRGRGLGGVRGASFASCAGLAYPGALIGWAPTWNAHGLFMTVNTLYPKRIKEGAASTSFVQREAMCGVGRGHDLDDVVRGLAYKGWAEGASLNLMDTVGRSMANVETWQDTHDVLYISEKIGNSSHFNTYQRLPVAQDVGLSSLERRLIVDALPAPRTRDDVARMLSHFAILRGITIASLVVDGATGALDVWGGTAPATHEPLYRWNIKPGSFFGRA